LGNKFREQPESGCGSSAEAITSVFVM